MKYITLEYDMNSPRDKAISVPLDSDYGLAVKVYKNGALLQSSISVDQQTALSNYNGWQLFELSSGSQPCQKLIVVQAAEVNGAHYGHTWTEHVENMSDEPDEFNTFLPLSAMFEEGTLRLEASKTQLSGWLAGVQISTDMLYVIKDYGTPDQAYWNLSVETGKWVSILDQSVQRDYLDVKTTDVINAQYTLSAQQSAELRVVVEADVSEEGEAAGFKLVVQEKDMGYIDTFN